MKKFKKYIWLVLVLVLLLAYWFIIRKQPTKKGHSEIYPFMEGWSKRKIEFYRNWFIVWAHLIDRSLINNPDKEKIATLMYYSGKGDIIAKDEQWRNDWEKFWKKAALNENLNENGFKNES